MIPINRTPKKVFQRKLGIAFLFMGIILNTIFRFGSTDKMVSENVVIIVSLMGVILILIGSYLFYRSRQYAAKALAEEIVGNSKPYVLYLRPFKSDTSIGKYMFSQFYFGNLISMEEQLADVLKPFGDLLAIGQPGETLPRPGAAKVYTSNDWKEVVISKMKSAQLVIILAGTGEGLLWELQEAFKILSPKKLLILIPPMSKKSYESFCVEAKKHFEIILPQMEQIKQKVGSAVSQGFIKFSSDWKSSFLPLKSVFLRKNPYQPYLSQFTFALKPVYEDFGIEWHKPPYSKFLKIAGGLILLLLLFIVIILVLAYLHV